MLVLPAGVYVPAEADLARGFVSDELLAGGDGTATPVHTAAGDFLELVVAIAFSFHAGAAGGTRRLQATYTGPDGNVACAETAPSAVPSLTTVIFSASTRLTRQNVWPGGIMSIALPMLLLQAGWSVTLAFLAGDVGDTFGTQTWTIMRIPLLGERA